MFVNLYSDAEIKEILNNHLGIIIDKREKENGHIVEWLENKKIKYKLKTLDVGDYVAYIEPNDIINNKRDIMFNKTIVERKNGLNELVGNLTDKTDRFERELQKSMNKNVLLIIEDGTYKDIVKHNYISKYNPKAFIARMNSFENKYKVNFNFIEKELSGHWIYSKLYYAVRNLLKYGD